MNKLTIAHCRINFLPQTEVFIENQINNLESFDPAVLTREISERFLNIGQFKIFSKKKGFLNWIFRKMSRKEKRFFTNVIFERDIKLIHCHFGADAWYFGKLKRITELPLIVSFYGYDAYQLPERFFGLGKIILKSVFKNADICVAPSEHMKKRLAELGCPEEKIEVLPWGVPHPPTPSPARSPRKLRSFDSRSWRGGVIKFLHIGRMVEKKGQIYLLEAFKEVLDRGVNAELTIIGDGPLRKKLYKTLDNLEIYDKVSVIDKLSNEAVLKQIASHNVYIQPSVEAANGDQEGIPTAIMEAMSARLPVIATTHSGIPEIAANNISGILVPEKDSKSLADAMEKLAKNPELCKKFGESGRKIIEEKFDIKKQMRKMEKLYISLLVY